VEVNQESIRRLWLCAAGAVNGERFRVVEYLVASKPKLCSRISGSGSGSGRGRGKGRERSERQDGNMAGRRVETGGQVRNGNGGAVESTDRMIPIYVWYDTKGHV
jgi:hypothetical protein